MRRGKNDSERNEMSYKFEDFCNPSAELPKDAHVHAKVSALENEFASLKAKVASLEASPHADRKSINDWFKERATDTFVSLRDEAIQKMKADGITEATKEAFEEMLVDYGNELGRHLYSQILETLGRR
jgi:flagellar biosynthesis/type III secretory pathway protein FliH